MDVESLFVDSSFLFLEILDLYCIDVISQFKSMNFVYFYKIKLYLKKMFSILKKIIN